MKFEAGAVKTVGSEIKSDPASGVIEGAKMAGMVILGYFVTDVLVRVIRKFVPQLAMLGQFAGLVLGIVLIMSGVGGSLGQQLGAGGVIYSLLTIVQGFLLPLLDSVIGKQVDLIIK